jgi:short-subunit dehydrogenase
MPGDTSTLLLFLELLSIIGLQLTAGRLSQPPDQEDRIMQLQRGDWALVTGASSGIGREFCGQLAAAGMNLVLVARRKPLLAEAATALSEAHGVRCLVVAVDLSQPRAAEKVHERVAGEGQRVRLLVNNAAFGRWGRFEDTPAADYEAMVQTNAVALVSLCRVFLADLTSFPSSAIINLSSPAALQPTPYMAVYAATKAFVHNFSQALYGEWHAKGVLVQTLVPGPTATEFDAKAGAYESALKERGTPQEVVAAALAHLNRDVPLVATAKGTLQQRFFAGLFPSKMVIKTVARMFQPPEKS